jgi:hypothetical protein
VPLPQADKLAWFDMHQVADGLGVSVREVRRWVALNYLPAKVMYPLHWFPVEVISREGLELWLMRPRPAWMLVEVGKVRDPRLRLILQNAQAEDRGGFYWVRPQVAAQKYFVSARHLNALAQKGRIGRLLVEGRAWLYEPDVARWAKGEIVGEAEN